MKERKGGYKRNVKKFRIKKNCILCNKEFEVILSQESVKYCSKKCRDIGRIGRAAPKTAFKKGCVSIRKGITVSPETLLKMTIVNKANAKRGWDNPFYKGGVKESQKRYKEKNREYYVIKQLIRRDLKLGSEGTFTINEWKEMKKNYKYTCPCCKRTEPEIKLTIDHIMPLSRGGRDSIDNIQPLCQSCNSSKYTKTIKYEQE